MELGMKFELNIFRSLSLYSKTIVDIKQVTFLFLKGTTKDRNA